MNYATADGTAIAGTNYTATSGTLTFAPGVTTETIRVPILDSGSQTAPLTFTLNLSNPEAATLSQQPGRRHDRAQRHARHVLRGQRCDLGHRRDQHDLQIPGLRHPASALRPQP